MLLGWASREPVLGGQQGIVTVNGLFRPFVLVDGRAAGTWSYQGGQVALSLSARLPDETQAALAAEAADVQRFLGAPLAPPGTDREAGHDHDEAA